MNKQVIELVAPIGFEVTDIKLQLKPSRAYPPPPPTPKIKVECTPKADDRPPPLEQTYCRVCANGSNSDVCAVCYLSLAPYFLEEHIDRRLKGLA